MELAMEIWKPIESLPGYSVSNEGRVRKDSNGQIMVTSTNNGYVRFTVSKHVHRLVAEAFLDKPKDENKCWIDHIDGNRANNNVDNLRWVTPSENAMSYGYESRRRNKRRKVIATNLDGEKLEFVSRQEAAAYFGCSNSEIKYNHRYTRGSKRGWLLQKAEDIV